MARGYAAVGLVNPKCVENIGGAFRAAQCYGAAMIAVAGERPQRLGRLVTDVGKAWRHIPLIVGDQIDQMLPYECVPVAVERVAGARSLPLFWHPERAFYVFGPEDGSLDDAVLSWCRSVIEVPTRISMNLAATVNVVLYDRMAKHCAEEAARDA